MHEKTRSTNQARKRVSMMLCMLGEFVFVVAKVFHDTVNDFVTLAFLNNNRRGDFQYTPTRLPANELYELSKNEFTEGATLYVATDERNKTFFDIFKEKYDVVFLDDFMHVIPDVNTNYYGMIDQLVSYKSRVFYGTWWSTLSGYVNRMRGYYITKHKLEGWEDGTMQSWYFTPEERVSSLLISLLSLWWHKRTP